MRTSRNPSPLPPRRWVISLGSPLPPDPAQVNAGSPLPPDPARVVGGAPSQNGGPATGKARPAGTRTR